jgi:four helix bundle protein
MAFRKFEELPAWRAAIELAVRVYDLSKDGAFRGHPGLRDQIERAALSVSNNMAEGYERGTLAELLTFLYYARGSLGEVRSMLGFLCRAGEWAEVRSEVESLIALCHNIAGQLGAWIESVKNSDYGGHREQNETTRKVREMRAHQAAFMEELRRAQRGPLDPPPPPIDGESL